MRKFSTLAVISLACAGMADAQGRPLDWSFYGGDAQRTGWEKSDSRITKENVKDFQLVLKRKLDNQQTGPRSLTPPVIVGNLISYRGFKELAFVAGSSGNLWAIDADMDRMFWQKHFDTPPNKNAANSSPLCSASVTATPSLTPPMNFAAGRPRAAGGPGPGAPGGAPAPAPAARTGVAAGAARGTTGAIAFGAPRPIYIISADGKLHRLNTSDGSDQVPPVNFLPAGAKASTLTVFDNTVYTTTSSRCGGAPDGVWAIDLSGDTPHVATFASNAGGVSGLGGLALGTDGTVYVQTGPGLLDPAAHKWSNTLLALTPKDLKVRQYFTPPDTGPNTKSPAKANEAANTGTPVVFAYKGRDLIVSSAKDGRLYLLDSQSPGGDDHKTALYATAQLSSAGVWGGLSSWEDPAGTRWVLAPVWGALNADLKSLLTNGEAPNGSIVAFKLEEQSGKLLLTPAWVSRDMSSPEPPVITSGVVFALSAGEYTRDEQPKGSHATLYALDGTTGKEMYSTGDQVSAPGNLTGVTIANGRVYFTTNDNTLYAFGIFLER